jgi:hypothetical protein
LIISSVVRVLAHRVVTVGSMDQFT